MFEVGQKVKVTDQRPPAIGIVEKISTWRELHGEIHPKNTCYYIRCPCWQGTARWISALFVEAASQVVAVDSGFEPRGGSMFVVLSYESDGSSMPRIEFVPNVQTAGELLAEVLVARAREYKAVKMWKIDDLARQPRLIVGACSPPVLDRGEVEGAEAQDGQQ